MGVEACLGFGCLGNERVCRVSLQLWEGRGEYVKGPVGVVGKLGVVA